MENQRYDTVPLSRYGTAISAARRASTSSGSPVAPGHDKAWERLQTVARNDGDYDAVFIGAGGASQRFGRIDEVAERVSMDAGSVDFITTINPDI